MYAQGGKIVCTEFLAGGGVTGRKGMLIGELTREVGYSS